MQEKNEKAGGRKPVGFTPKNIFYVAYCLGKAKSKQAT